MMRETHRFVLRYLGVLAALALLAGTGLTLGGCQTVEGAGRDVQDLGRGVERGAEETRPY